MRQLHIRRYFHSLGQFIIIFLDILTKVFIMGRGRFYAILTRNIEFVLLAVWASLIIIFGGIGVYLAEHEHRGANITSLADALWWAVVTITTVGYGDYYPVTLAGRLIAVFMMFSGIGIIVLFVSTIAQRRLSNRVQRWESWLKPKAEVQSELGDETRTAIINKIQGIEKMNEEDFDRLIIMIKSLRRTLLEASKVSYKCSGCAKVYHSKSKFCSNCGLAIT
jgi:voltage-gated potassium channel